MSDESPRSYRPFAMCLATIALAASACSGGVRPTLTAEALVEPNNAITTVVPAADVAAQPAATALPGTESVAIPDLAPGEVEQLVVQVLETFPHDTAAYTQGLELDNGMFIESTGEEGKSDLRRVVPATGEITQIVETPNDFFAEGVTKVGDELIQITWTENTAFYWDAVSFELKKEVFYDGQGWGICYDGTRLVMTDGNVPALIFRDPTTFAEIGRVTVTFDDQEVFNLNELECVNGVVWANVWLTNVIVRIDPSTGNVTGLVDAASLDAPSDDSDGDGDDDGRAVLNGIAWDEATQSFYVTGKLWPTMYRVNFVPVSN